MFPTMDYSVLAFYSLHPIDDPQKEVMRHKEFLASKDFRSRIYISEQGINGQASGSIQAAQEYMEWLSQDARFSQTSFKIHLAKEHAFPKMTIKYRRQLVAIDCEVDLSSRGEPVSSHVWKKMLEERGDETLLIDVRNDYEWEAGHFEGAELPKLDTFRQFPSYAKELKTRCDPKQTPIMMYCTGGIRCEFYSAVLKKEGFEKVYQLDGGVIQYGLDEGSEHWKGKLFVFDDRLVVPIGENPETIAECHHCSVENDVYYNCANMDCNKLFFCCLSCLREHKGCCSLKCLEEGRVRPFTETAKPFRKQHLN
jgi:UPF0176 protein